MKAPIAVKLSKQSLRIQWYYSNRGILPHAKSSHLLIDSLTTHWKLHVVVSHFDAL